MSEPQTSSEPYSVEIRDRKRADDDSVIDIANRQLRLGWKKNTVHHHLKNQFRYMSVATIDGMVVGFVQYSLQRGARVEVELIAVHPEWTGVGVGSALMKSLCALPSKVVALTCKEDDIAMQMIIGRLGFWKESLLVRDGKRMAVFLRSKQ